jgi:uncharacterized spore protein YtfJ
MKVTYGMKMISEEDIISATRGRPRICNYLRDHPDTVEDIDGDSKVLVETGMGGNIPSMNVLRPYRMLFVSIPAAEEKIIFDFLYPNLEKLSTILIDQKRLEKIDVLKSRIYTSCEKASETLLNEKSPSIMFLYDEDELLGVHTAIPKEILDIITQKPNMYVNLEGGGGGGGKSHVTNNKHKGGGGKRVGGGGGGGATCSPMFIMKTGMMGLNIIALTTRLKEVSLLVSDFLQKNWTVNFSCIRNKTT